MGKAVETAQRRLRDAVTDGPHMVEQRVIRPGSHIVILEDPNSASEADNDGPTTSPNNHPADDIPPHPNAHDNVPTTPKRNHSGANDTLPAISSHRHKRQRFDIAGQAFQERISIPAYRQTQEHKKSTEDLAGHSAPNPFPELLPSVHSRFDTVRHAPPPTVPPTSPNPNISAGAQQLPYAHLLTRFPATTPKSSSDRRTSLSSTPLHNPRVFSKPPPKPSTISKKEMLSSLQAIGEDSRRANKLLGQVLLDMQASQRQRQDQHRPCKSGESGSGNADGEV